MCYWLLLQEVEGISIYTDAYKMSFNLLFHYTLSAKVLRLLLSRQIKMEMASDLWFDFNVNVHSVTLLIRPYRFMLSQ